MADKTLDELLAESKTYIESLTPEEKQEMLKRQAKSWVRSIMERPKPKFKWANGVKVYDSFEDYCND